MAQSSTLPPTPVVGAPPSCPPSGMYGPRGWSVQVGIWEILAPHLELGNWDLLSAPAARVVGGAPVTDYLAFSGVGAKTARLLLDALPTAALADRQNYGPSLGACLRASLAHPELRLAGYGIGPQRGDERVTVTTLVVRDFVDRSLTAHHTSHCECGALWQAVAHRYQLDAVHPPDEITQVWVGAGQLEAAWRLWWD